MAYSLFRPVKPRKPKKPPKPLYYGPGKNARTTRVGRVPRVPDDPRYVNNITNTADASIAQAARDAGAPGNALGGSNPAVDNGPGTDYGSFYPFRDHTSELLASLAASKDRMLAQLKANMEGRAAAATKTFNEAIPVVHNDFAQASQSAAAVNEAVANRLRAQGGEAGQSLLEKLAAISAPTAATEAATGDLAKYYQGIGGANYAGNSGDIQMLIGRGAEEEAWLAKQPSIIRQQLESDYGAETAQVMADFLDRQSELQMQGLSERDSYDQAKWEWEMGVKEQQKAERMAKDEQTAADRKEEEDRYWDNYWKKAELLERQWEIKLQQGDKKAANKLKAEIEAAKRQAQLDVADIRAGTSTSNAALAAETSRANNAATNAQREADRRAKEKAAAAKAKAEKNKPKPVSQKVVNEARNRAKNAVIVGGKPKGGLKSDNQVQGIVNNILKQYGIPPYGSQGTAIRRWVFSQLNATGKWKSGRVP